MRIVKEARHGRRSYRYEMSAERDASSEGFTVVELRVTRLPRGILGTAWDAVATLWRRTK